MANLKGNGLPMGTPAKRGRPMTAAKPLDQRVPLMMSVDEVAAVDEWRRYEPDIPTRSEAIRRLVARGLKAKG